MDDSTRTFMLGAAVGVLAAIVGVMLGFFIKMFRDW